MAHNLARWTARLDLGEQVVTTKTLRRRFFCIAGRLSPARRAASFCICHNVGPGKPSSVTPWHDCAPCHFLPDGSPSATDPPSGQLNVPANSVREGHFLPTACRIPPTMAIAGRHHRVCVATSRRPHPHLLESALACSPSLAHPYGGFGLNLT